MIRCSGCIARQEPSPPSGMLGSTIPPRRNRSEAICFSAHLYRAPNLVERFFNKLKQCRRVDALRELPANYLAFIQLVNFEPRERNCARAVGFEIRPKPLSRGFCSSPQ